MKYFCLFLLLLVSTCKLAGQSQSSTNLVDLSNLSQHGEYRRLIEAAESFAGDPQRTSQELGRSFIYKGFALQQLGRYAEATAAYERSLQLLNHNQKAVSDYAAALSAFATLYMDSGQREEAHQILKKALHVYGTQQDHAGLAIVWMNLASLACRSNSESETRKYLAHAAEESQHVNSLDNDYRASISSAQAWLAQRRGDTSGAISGYQHSLALLLPVHGSQHPLIGRLYMLIGKAYLAAGDTAGASENMRKGLDILRAAFGTSHPQYLAAEVTYSKALDATGAHEQASNLRHQALAALSDLRRQNCVQCRISAEALR